MQFFNRLFGSDSTHSRVRPGERSPRRRGAQFRLETLEDRDLKSDIPGVSANYGQIQITATQPSHNVANVAIDPANQMVKVTLNGQSEEFDPATVCTINFSGSQGGFDTFTNDTSLTEMAYGYGGNNTFSGGSCWNVVYLYGDNNTYDARGASSYVFAFNGPNDNIPQYGDVSIYDYSYDPSWFGW